MHSQFTCSGRLLGQPCRNTGSDRSKRIECRASARAAPALKEWAPLIEALGHGQQTLLFRKGGIKEPLFKPPTETFLLFPTQFHTDSKLLKPEAQHAFSNACNFDPKAQQQLSFPFAAQITGAWTTMDTNVLPAVQPLHICAPGFLENRLRWRAAQPLTILELRVMRCANVDGLGACLKCQFRRHHCWGVIHGGSIDTFVQALASRRFRPSRRVLGLLFMGRRTRTRVV